MKITMSSVTCCVAALFATSTTARAATGGFAGFGAMNLDREDVKSVSAVTADIGVGGGTDRFVVSAHGGYTWGTLRDGFLSTKGHLHRVRGGVRVGTNFDARNPVALSLSYGQSYPDWLITTTWDIAVDAQVNGTRGVGPALQVGFGVGQFGLVVEPYVHRTSNDWDWGVNAMVTVWKVK
jgi:hypothetical protein